MTPRMTKKELRQDPVMEAMQKALGFGQQYGKWLALGAAGIIILIAVALLVIQGRQAAAEQAATELMMARSQIMQGQLAQARSSLESVVTRYGSSDAAKEAYLLLGDVELAMDNAEGARRAFSEALARLDEPILTMGAQRGLAAALEDLGRFAEASQTYEELAGASLDPVAIENLVNAARTAREAGDRDRAYSLYERALAMAEEKAPGRVSQIEMSMAEIAAERDMAAGELLGS
ncbi:MAG: tetratricopeptide repeat protein [Candidatus Eisenbacteria bacterium]|nr:tetratricopeptide repeat protein [Candidatus Eisenbacteria bacterium]